MTKKWTSDARQRKSKKFRETHEKLRKELEAANVLKPEPAKPSKQHPWWLT